MAGKKRFESSLFGFKKSDVNDYIENMLEDFIDKVNSKDKELFETKNQLQEITAKYDQISMLADGIKEDRSSIAEVFIQAKEKADLMIEEAKVKAIEEKKEIEVLIEKEKEKLVDLKAEIKDLKEDVAIILKKYQNQLESIVPADDSESKVELIDEDVVIEEDSEDNKADEDDIDADDSDSGNTEIKLDEKELYNLYGDDEETQSDSKIENEETENSYEEYQEMPKGKSFYTQDNDEPEESENQAKPEDNEKQAESEKSGEDVKNKKTKKLKEIEEVEEIDKVDELKEILEFYTSDEKDYHIK